MDIGALFLSLVVIILVAGFVLVPFRKHRLVQTDSGQEISTLLAERDRILKEIQELDFDNSLGKIPPDEYLIQRKTLLQQGVEILRQLDSFDHSTQAPGTEVASVHAAVAAELSRQVNLISDEDLEELIAKRRAIRKEATGGFCPKCGKPFLKSDQFCSCCGEPVGIRA